MASGLRFIWWRGATERKYMEERALVKEEKIAWVEEERIVVKDQITLLCQQILELVEVGGENHPHYP